MASANSYPTTPFEVLGSRLEQADGVLAAIQASYDSTVGYTLSEDLLNSALYGLSELLEQAKAAFDEMVDDQLAKKRPIREALQ